MKNLLIILFLGAGLSACSFGVYKNISANNISVINTNQKNAIDSIVEPYKVEIDGEMNQIIGTAHVDFIKNRPNGNLNNLITDILLSAKKEFGLTNEPVICIQNFGGLRTSINKGKVTIGDIFKVLPFDNFVYAVKLPHSAEQEVIEWIKQSGGHPIAGCKVFSDKIVFNNQKEINDDFWVITSDYLYNGGDHALFFNKKIAVKESGILLRDVVIKYIKANPNLLDDSKERIKLN
jgi:2',3'-cyclic-nucleotide 2'-phosphodiesterase (5'-nucleotidase family)